MLAKNFRQHRNAAVETLPDGLAGGFVFDSRGEGGMRLILKQEGQRCLCCV